MSPCHNDLIHAIAGQQNVEANYYGAASSNHAEAMAPYFPTLDALVPLGRQRASLKSWAHGGHGAGGTAGQMAESMGCACDNCESAATVCLGCGSL